MGAPAERSSPSLEIVRTVRDLRSVVRAWKGSGASVGVVPTMGAIHEGHLALVDAATAANDRVVATLFVNPTQFGENEDFDGYPRDEATDAAALAARGTDLLFAPPPDEMYPAGFTTGVRVGGLTDGLCGAHRPGHFEGVATVVTKLLNQCGASRAYFGEKDYQQLRVIARLAADLDIDTEIVGVETVRESDGLALSSRNQYLTEDERRIAPELHRTLQTVADALRDGSAEIAPVVRAAADGLVAAGFASVDYLEVRDADTLAPMVRVDRPARVFAAAHLGRARLIDNTAV